MGGLPLYVDSASDHIYYKSCLCNNTCEKSCIEQENYTSSHLDTVVATSVEDLVVHELGSSLHRILHVQETSNHVTTCNQKDIQSLPLEEDLQKCLSAYAIIPSSRTVRPHALLIDGIGESDSSVDKTLSQAGTLASPNSMLIPVKLISCIKGARALHGMSPKASFRVKWAPEVYDPPVTSTSRTVKSPNQRSKAKQKEHYKHKSNKGKSPRRIINEAKYANRRSKYNATDPHIIRLHSLGDRSVPLKFGHPNIHVLDFAGTAYVS
ncbi:hypothetical protein J5N97_003681 [Dioscorea zingiberensis]|uniref:Uncharacterized protein n=1 Tax=Dioscorea zingiberensis TaxID=325984 RepID=A0A9D5D4K8_9LILI|nr:hypothetical protein J5N97_003681 [Dioscorea zingiberensis]